MSTTSRVWLAGELGTFRGGSGFPIRHQGKKSGDLPFFKVSDMNSGGNELFMTRANNYISEAQRKTLGAVRMPAQAIVFAKVGAAVFQERKRILAQDSCIDNNMAAFIVDKGKLDVRFAHYLLTAFRMSDLVAVGALPSLNGRQLRSIPLLVPSDLAEQRRIVAALADADSLIATLERLIAKKQAIKQGMMQQLLTGRTRLPGFTDEWRRLDVASRSVVKARIGWQGLKTGEYRDSGIYRLVGGTEFVDGRIDWSKTPFVDKWRYDQDSYIQLCVGDVLLTKDGTIGKTAYVDALPGPATLNSGVFVIRPVRDAYDPAFLYWMLRSRAFDEFLARLTAGSTISHLYQRDLVTLVLNVPASIEEQRAIAGVLGDAEAEVATLEVCLTKARAIKTGMMQQLLTGRTRLPPEVVS